MQFTSDTEKYTAKLREWLKTLFTEKEEQKSTERFSIFLSEDSIQSVHINKTEHHIKLLSQETLKYDNAENLPLILDGLIHRSHLDRVPIFWLLTPEDYQLFLIDSIPVEKGEFYEALKWRARSLINYPVDEAVIDAFKLPPKRGATTSMLAAVIAKKNKLASIISLLAKSDAKIDTIYIPELAMRNLSALHEHDEKSSAFIYFYDTIAILNITREKSLYFTRHIPLSRKNETNDIDFEQFCLDLQRYFDYYQSQWRHPNPNRIFIAGANITVDEVSKKLSEYMTLTFSPYKLIGIEGVKDDLYLCEKQTLLAFGCALREDTNEPKTRN